MSTDCYIAIPWFWEYPHLLKDYPESDFLKEDDNEDSPSEGWKLTYRIMRV